MKAFQLLFITSFVAVSIYSCKGQKGETGPTGPTGSSGSIGNANVQTVVFQVTPSQWSFLRNEGTSALMVYAKPMTQISQRVVDSGLVNLYRQSPDGWRNLSTSEYGHNLTYSFVPDTLKVLLYQGTSVIQTETFKAVIADGF